ncbi:hypothetical protein EYC84_001740 [Monilinia fructicola]|uniref:Uncharacterized protein n=1 Tax=Monilinia fructicola TaxID=38448 RepID=A0A5M9JT24_MONFR|nr:hypothetical protein EYC84_001740 [Monilinia fructicola]
MDTAPYIINGAGSDGSGTQSFVGFIYCHRVSTNDLRNLIVEKVRSLLFSTRFDSSNNQLSALCLAHPTFSADVFQEIRQHPDQANHCNHNDCSMHTFHNLNTSSHTSPESHFEVESPPHESEYLDDISDLALDDGAPSLVSDCGTISPEEEDACSEMGRDEAMMEYYESRDMVMSFDRAYSRPILN